MKTRFRKWILILGKKIYLQLLTIGLLFTLNSGNAQINVDSLRQIVPTLSDIEEQITVYSEIAGELFISDPELCLLYTDTLRQLGEQANNNNAIGTSYYYSGICFSVLGDYQKMNEQALLALEYAENEDEQIDYLTLLGASYAEMFLLEKATEVLLEATKIAERKNDLERQAVLLSNLADIFANLADTVKAKKYYNKTADLFKKSNAEPLYIANTYNSMSLVEANDSLRLIYLDSAFHLMPKEGNEYYLGSIFSSYAHHYAAVGNQELERQYRHKSLQASRITGDAYMEIEALTYLGEYHLAQNSIDSANYYLNASLEKVKEENYPQQYVLVYDGLVRLYRKQGDLLKENEALNLLISYRDTLYNVEKTREIEENAAKYEFEKNQRQIAEQQLQLAQSQNTRNAIIFGALILLLGVAAIYQRYLSQQRKKQQAAELALATQQAESQRLKELDQLKTNFFTNISHELRTPLTLILSPLADVMNGIKSNPVKQKLQIIQNNGQRLLGLVNEIMDLSKLEAGKLEVNAVNVHLLPFMKRLFSAFESLATIRKITYQSNFNIASETMVKLDIDKFEKIINNLLGNALKYNVSGGSVTLDVRQEDKHFEFKITDTGRGITKEDLPYIFNRFYQSKTKSQDLQGGTGIGLALSKELTELLGGELTVESELGRGSVFTLKLPLKLQVSDAFEASDASSDPSVADNLITSIAPFQPIFINGEKPKILVVEDNPEMSKYLVQILSEHYQCTTATDGQAALKQLKLYAFDAILSDVMMPNMDGFEFRERINEDAALRQIPFLMLTARSLEADKIRGLQLGIDDYMTKPFSTNELNARLQNLIKNKLERDEFLKSQQTDNQEKETLSADQQILQQAEAIILKNIDNPKFKVPDLAKEIGYSSKQLGRIIKQITGLSTVGFILEIRLQKARTLLEKRIYPTVLEVQYEVGINSTSYFTKKFTERFGKNPKELIGR